MSRHRPTRPVTRSQTGGSLVEILVVVLILGLVAAAMMAGLMEKTAKMESAKSEPNVGTGDLAHLLAQWTSDPQAQPLDPQPLDTVAERQAYQAMVADLEKSGRLGSWKEFLREHLEADHPLLVALEPDAAEPTHKGPVEIRLTSDLAGEAAETPSESDPEIRWSDGEPVRLVEDHDP